MENNKKVYICFVQPGINSLFSELLRQRGINCEITSSPEDLSAETKIITEANFNSKISSILPENKLFIGTKNTVANLNGIKLVQPLSEECLENALSELLD